MRSVGELQSGLRRSKRSTRQRVNYRQYAVSDTEEGYTKRFKPPKLKVSDVNWDPSDELEMPAPSPESQQKDIDEKLTDQNSHHKQQARESAETTSSSQEEDDSAQRRFLDLNKLAPVIGIDDGSRPLLKDEDVDNFLPSKAQTVHS